MKRGYQITAALTALFLAGTAQAHTFGAHGAGFAAGFAHPFAGLDHLLAMAAVGVWAAQLGGRAVWRVPVTFVTMMALGSMLALGGMTLPAVETGIASSVLVSGLLVAFAVRLPLAASAMLIGVFAVFHGYAHGTELPQAASAALYAAGFLLATAALLALGFVTGAVINHRLAPAWLCTLGGGIAAAGVVLIAG